jgi:HTH-type transcriptional regulator/antitoxin HipB
MLIRTPADLGAVIRDRRKRLKLDQSTLAKRIGASRQWVIEVEHGHPRAELGLVLRALDALGIPLQAGSDQGKSHGAGVVPAAVDINAIVAKARKRKP